MPWVLGHEDSRARKEKNKMQEQHGGFYTIAAWQRGDDLAVKIYQTTQKFPRYELYGLTSQLRRAAVSVPANIAEGSGRRTIRDYIRFLYIAKGSLTEVEYLVHISNRLGYLTEADFRQLREDLRRTAGTLLGFIQFKEREAQAQEE
jgi:four helix bundle protein